MTDPVVEAIARAARAVYLPHTPVLAVGDGWLAVGEAVLADADLRAKIGAWTPPPDMAELAMYAFSAELHEARGVTPTSDAFRAMIATGWTFTPPEDV